MQQGISGRPIHALAIMAVAAVLQAADVHRHRRRRVLVVPAGHADGERSRGAADRAVAREGGRDSGRREGGHLACQPADRARQPRHLGHHGAGRRYGASRHRFGARKDQSGRRHGSRRSRAIVMSLLGSRRPAPAAARRLAVVRQSAGRPSTGSARTGISTKGGLWHTNTIVSSAKKAAARF